MGKVRIKSKHMVFKFLGVIFGIISLIILGIYLWLYFYPQGAIGLVQKAVYSDGNINSYEPRTIAKEVIKENGVYYVTEIKYSEEYPNSYLDITYGSEDRNVDRPTVIYFHGGGYFGGSKTLEDPLAAPGDMAGLYEYIALQGFNFVNIDYALVPEYHFPVPLIQMNQAINFLYEHATKYNLNMDNVIIAGSSAGAILTSQYGALISNEEYQESLNIYPNIPRENIKGLIIDDAPIVTEKFDLYTSTIIKNYLNVKNIKKKSDITSLYNPISHINANYPNSFLTAGNEMGYPDDMEIMSEKLRENNVYNEFYFKDKSYETLSHGFLSEWKTKKYSKECLDKIIDFINKCTK